MFNDNLRKNWLKIIEFNAKVENIEKARATSNKLRIPLTPIDIEAYLLYYMFDILYPKFINDQPNVLDIIISNDGIDILNLYLYETKRAGIHESYQKLPINIIKDKFFFQKLNLENIDAFFNKLQLIIADKRKVKISSVRIFKKKAIDIINEYCNDIIDLSIYNFFRKIIELLQKLIEQNLIDIYPEPNILRFLKDVISFLKDIKLIDVFDFIDDILPFFNIAIVFLSQRQDFILNVIKEITQSETPEYKIKITAPKELGMDLDDLTRDKIIDAVQEQVNPENMFFLNQDDLISLLLDFFEIDIPIEKEQFQLILQKILYGLRTYEINWFKIPRARNMTLKRFFIKLLNLNFNVKKISHWTIPETITNLFNSYFGLKSKILVIYTDIKKHVTSNANQEDYLDVAFKKGIMLEIENGSLTDIVPIEKDLIISDNKINTIEAIRIRLSEMQGYISAVITLDRSVLMKVINDFMINFSKSKLLSKLKTLKMVKNQKYFNIYPEFPLFKLLKESGKISLLKTLTSISIDLHEF